MNDQHPYYIPFRRDWITNAFYLTEATDITQKRC